ncbi:MAG: NAD(P)-dependent alcohol dehydrogenase [Leptospiraceae bacterium]|nr:NAD(P)-dependent alcohol dehydrogenase [Leptospiraceae bacterium]
MISSGWSVTRFEAREMKRFNDIRSDRFNQGANMKAVLYHRYGDVNVLQMADIPRPVPEANELLIEIHAGSVNPIDWKLRQGALRLIRPLNLPAIPGFDVSGQVIAIGSNVRTFKVGDAVYARSNKKAGEASAEYIALPEDVVARKPSNMSHAEAAAVPLAGLTALQALRNLAHIRTDATLLVNGASGGVGSYAVQIAKALGVRTVVGVCSAANAELVRRLGADEVIDYKTADPLREHEYDVIFDAVSTLGMRAMGALRRGGIYISTLPGPVLALGNIIGLFGGKRARVIMVRPHGADLEFLRQMAEENKLMSVIDSEYTLEQIQSAHTASQAGRARGKIVIKIQ